MAEHSVCMTAQKQHSLDCLHQKIHQIPGFEIIAKREIPQREGMTWLLVYEKYFYRIRGYAAVIILLEEQGEHQYAQIIVAGVGTGIGNFSLGAGKKLAKETAKALEDVGFAVEQRDTSDLPKGLLKRFMK